MDNIYTWDGPGYYGSAGKSFMGSHTDTRRINMDGWEDWEAGQASRQQGYGTPHWYEKETELRKALGYE